MCPLFLGGAERKNEARIYTYRDENLLIKAQSWVWAG